MIWELAAIWAIVLSVLVWFFRSERQRHGGASLRAVTRIPAAIAESHDDVPAPVRMDPERLADMKRRFVQAVGEPNG